MNLLLRLLKVLISSLLGRRLTILDPSVVAFRVWPNDLDVNLHMNNGRYMTVMDLGRFDLMIRAGLVRPILRNGWMPVIASAAVRYRRSLAPFERYRLRTRLLGWDEKWLYLEQVFETMDGRIAAIGLVRGVFKRRSGSVPTPEIIRALGLDIASPPLPQEIRDWAEVERQLFDMSGESRVAA